MEAIILAGGLGTRLRAAVPDLPKPMAPIHGRPFLEHQMDYWIAQGVTRFILSVGYKRELIEAHFGTAYRKYAVTYAREEEPLGTGGGLLLALAEAQTESILVLNGDTFLEVVLESLCAQHAAKQAQLTIALRRVPHNDRYGEVLLNADQAIAAFSAKPSGSEGIINGGVYMMQREAILSLGWKAGDKVALEQDLFPALLDRKLNIFGVEYPGAFIDIGVPEDYQRAASLLPN
jgi:D-glycero-alpha-D-manno-heptose 1-phosphate guanylyltransferase